MAGPLPLNSSQWTATLNFLRRPFNSHVDPLGTKKNEFAITHVTRDGKPQLTVTPKLASQGTIEQVTVEWELDTWEAPNGFDRENGRIADRTILRIEKGTNGQPVAVVAEGTGVCYRGDDEVEAGSSEIPQVCERLGRTIADWSDQRVTNPLLRENLKRFIREVWSPEVANLPVLVKSQMPFKTTEELKKGEPRAMRAIEAMEDRLFHWQIATGALGLLEIGVILYAGLRLRKARKAMLRMAGGAGAADPTGPTWYPQETRWRGAFHSVRIRGLPVNAFLKTRTDYVRHIEAGGLWVGAKALEHEYRRFKDLAVKNRARKTLFAAEMIELDLPLRRAFSVIAGAHDYLKNRKNLPLGERDFVLPFVGREEGEVCLGKFPGSDDLTIVIPGSAGIDGISTRQAQLQSTTSGQLLVNGNPDPEAGVQPTLLRSGANPPQTVSAGDNLQVHHGDLLLLGPFAYRVHLQHHRDGGYYWMEFIDGYGETRPVTVENIETEIRHRWQFLDTNNKFVLAAVREIAVSAHQKWTSAGEPEDHSTEAIPGLPEELWIKEAVTEWLDHRQNKYPREAAAVKKSDRGPRSKRPVADLRHEMLNTIQFEPD